MDALGGVVIWSLIQLPEDDPGTDLGLGIGGRVKALRMSAVASPAQPSMLDVSGAGCVTSSHTSPFQSPLCRSSFPGLGLCLTQSSLRLQLRVLTQSSLSVSFEALR